MLFLVYFRYELQSNNTMKSLRFFFVKYKLKQKTGHRPSSYLFIVQKCLRMCVGSVLSIFIYFDAWTNKHKHTQFSTTKSMLGGNKFRRRVSCGITRCARNQYKYDDDDEMHIYAKVRTYGSPCIFRMPFSRSRSSYAHTHTPRDRASQTQTHFTFRRGSFGVCLFVICVCVLLSICGQQQQRHNLLLFKRPRRAHIYAWMIVRAIISAIAHSYVSRLFGHIYMHFDRAE